MGSERWGFLCSLKYVLSQASVSPLCNGTEFCRTGVGTRVQRGDVHRVATSHIRYGDALKEVRVCS